MELTKIVYSCKRVEQYIFHQLNGLAQSDLEVVIPKGAKHNDLLKWAMTHPGRMTISSDATFLGICIYQTREHGIWAVYMPLWYDGRRSDLTANFSIDEDSEVIVVRDVQVM